MLGFGFNEQKRFYALTVTGFFFKPSRTSSTWAKCGSANDRAPIPAGLSYYCLKHSNGKYAVLRVNNSVKSKTDSKETGVVSASAVVFASGTPTSQTIKNFTSAIYDTTSNDPTAFFAKSWIDCNLFGIELDSITNLYQHAWIQQPNDTHKMCIAYYTIDNTATGTGITGFKVP